MEFVLPIRDKKKIEDMKRWLIAQTPRDHLLFVLGINSGLRAAGAKDREDQEVPLWKERPEGH